MRVLFRELSKNVRAPHAPHARWPHGLMYGLMSHTEAIQSPYMSPYIWALCAQREAAAAVRVACSSAWGGGVRRHRARRLQTFLALEGSSKPLSSLSLLRPAPALLCPG